MTSWVRRRAGAASPTPAAAAGGSSAADALINDLLGRRPVNLTTPELQRFLAGKRVMVTGAGGSIGSEICRQTARFAPETLVLVERAEGLLFEIDRELRQRWLGVDVVPRLVDITDAKRLSRVMAETRPQVIFHCAAHKHVPLMELNPGEAVKNNVLGTQLLAEAAVHHGAAAMVMVSTDKAVNPTSVMGASKRCAEQLIQHYHDRFGDRTRFVAVRFGNVLGSSGSVVPIFQRQIAQGGPVTVTHPDMRRYFMTIPEASQLVMQAGAIGRGGEVFVLDMGEPVRILDLARALVRRSGLREGKDIEIVFTGVRPGEKLFEELNLPTELVAETSHPRIRVWKLPPVEPETATAMLHDLRAVADGSRTEVIDALRRWVPEYTPDDLPETARRELRLAA
ncbi:MAG: UDP-N-acetylglucosamine 4,6-dehydratase family protein [Tepidisphaerales bacterium]